MVLIVCDDLLDMYLVYYFVVLLDKLVECVVIDLVNLYLLGF